MPISITEIAMFSPVEHFLYRGAHNRMQYSRWNLMRTEYRGELPPSTCCPCFFLNTNSRLQWPHLTGFDGNHLSLLKHISAIVSMRKSEDGSVPQSASGLADLHFPTCKNKVKILVYYCFSQGAHR